LSVCVKYITLKPEGKQLCTNRSGKALMCRNHISALYGLWRVPPLTKYYITLRRRVFKRLAFDLQSSSETLRLNQCALKLAAGRTDVLSLYLEKNCCMHNFFGQGENEPLGMKEVNLEPAVEFSTRKISISNLFFPS